MEEFKDSSASSPLTRIGTDTVAKVLMQLFYRNKLNKAYSKNKDKAGMEFIDSVISTLDLDYEVNEDELKRIPKDGAFITVSNHPLGGIDALLLLKIIAEQREDYKIAASPALHRIEPTRDFMFSIRSFETRRQGRYNAQEIRYATQHLKQGEPLGIFPTGNATSYAVDLNKVNDRPWQESALQFIRKANVPVVPVYFQGNHSKFVNFLARIHPILANFNPTALFSKKNKRIKVRIGSPIPVKELKSFDDLSQYGRYLRARTYALGTSLEVKKFFRPRLLQRTKKVEDIIDAVPADTLNLEVEQLKRNYLLFDNTNFSVICAPSEDMPNLLTELGRLREITFRAVGEGTNNSTDLDEFDLYYNHLVIWDNDAHKIVGAYRVGRGKDILNQYGIEGFYTATLFKIDKELSPVLNESLELGRSFIVQEYQRKPLSLFLLWKGILYLLLKHTEYRYLVGPVSISNDFSKMSKNMIVEFIRQNYFNHEIARHIQPRKAFKVKGLKAVDKEILLEKTDNLLQLDKVIKEIESNLTTPVLLKKYLKLNAKIVGFNIDPNFNDCLDGLVVLDIFDVPIDVLKQFSKELNDDSILERFNLTEF